MNKHGLMMLVLEHYDLSNPYELLKNPHSKEQWKSSWISSNEKNNKYTEKSWKNEINGKCLLKYLNPDQDVLSVGKSHTVWASVQYNIQVRKRGRTKSEMKLLTGSFTIQANIANFNKYTVNPTCKLWNAEPEDRQHFLARCTYLSSFTS